MRLSARFCNREYNNRALFPEYVEDLARWQDRADAVRAARPDARLGLPYGGSPREIVDLFPTTRPGAPLLVFIHGGYWRSMSPQLFSWIAPSFNERGVNVALVGYDLAPAVGIPHITLQIVRALEWLWREGPSLGFDPNRIVVAGHSAGGHLAAMAGAALWPQWDPDLPSDLVKGVLSISGVHDLEPLLKADFVQGDLKLDAEQVARCSPAWMPPAGNAPLVTAVGGRESGEFRRQSALLGQRWSGNLRAALELPDRNHFDVVDALADPSHELFGLALALCKAPSGA